MTYVNEWRKHIMTIDEYAEDTGALDDNSGPTVDSMEQSMINH